MPARASSAAIALTISALGALGHRRHFTPFTHHLIDINLNLNLHISRDE